VQLRAGGEQAAGHRTAGGGQVFAVVQDQQRGVLPDPASHRIDQVKAGGVPGRERVRDGEGDHVAPGNRS